MAWRWGAPSGQQAAVDLEKCWFQTLSPLLELLTGLLRHMLGESKTRTSFSQPQCSLCVLLEGGESFGEP